MNTGFQLYTQIPIHLLYPCILTAVICRNHVTNLFLDNLAYDVSTIVGFLIPLDVEFCRIHVTNCFLDSVSYYSLGCLYDSRAGPGFFSVQGMTTYSTPIR